MHQDLNRDKYISYERLQIQHQAADQLELIKVSKHSTEMQPHATVVLTSLKHLIYHRLKEITK